MNDTIKIIILVISAYLVGNINIALIISKLMKKDVRTMGSKNAGTMNMVRNFGVKIGILTLILDAAKSAVTCILGWYFLGEKSSFDGSKIGVCIAAISVVIGNVFPVFLKFKGGKGIATTLGACFVLQPIVASIAFVCSIIFLIVFCVGSLSSFISTSAPLIAELICLYSDKSISGIVGSCVMLAMFAIIIFAHRQNISRLLKGTETRTKIFKK